ncbi:MAG: UPF0175 family protein [Candidatus Diapherotrites archaeon]|uniref:UPF0175 family protein n=1 Tax=Candidatus Iainarchaeum sp. TaxID=3101447 RepID=A0A8T3YIE7_9ARCH|nr:UPF0175 family protein [Candidatus Diapherotrites archaeon]
MQKVLSMRIDKADLDFVSLEAKEKKADKTAIIRSLIGKGRLHLAMEQYRKGKVSIGKAAQKAGITISEMMDKLAEFGVKSPVTKEQYLLGLKNAEKIL